jgi:hypothetical protein
MTFTALFFPDTYNVKASKIRLLFQQADTCTPINSSPKFGVLFIGGDFNVPNKEQN